MTELPSVRQVERVREATRAMFEELRDGIEREHERFQRQFHAIEEQYVSLATLHAANHALHASLKRADVLAAIQEIVINLVGSEQLAVVAADEQLTPHAQFGVTSAQLRGLTRDAGIIGRARQEGRTLALARDMPADATGVRVCIPLMLAGETSGFVLIFGFLPQKEELGPLDHELFSLLSARAGVALLACDALERRGGDAG
jgi:hypothetical protein